jgi:NADH-quinone oxidoreductase subunit L
MRGSGAVLDLLSLIPALPLAGFAVLTVAGRRLGDPAAGWVATVATAASFAVTGAAFFTLLGRPADERAAGQRLFTWLAAGGLEIDVGLLADPLSITTALFVTGVGAVSRSTRSATSAATAVSPRSSPT